MMSTKKGNDVIEYAAKLKEQKAVRVILLPGNGGGDTTKSLWYPWLKKKLEEKLNVPVLLTQFPDPYLARGEYWIPFVCNDLGAVGHSSGAVCALRILETTKVLGVALVAGYHSDLGDETEKESGYFDAPWQWEKIKQNAQWILQFHSTDDHLVPYEEGKYVHEQINSELVTLKLGHFQTYEFQELVDELSKKLSK